MTELAIILNSILAVVVMIASAIFSFVVIISLLVVNMYYVNKKQIRERENILITVDAPVLVENLIDLSDSSLFLSSVTGKAL